MRLTYSALFRQSSSPVLQASTLSGEILSEFARLSPMETLQRLHSTAEGLSPDEVAQRLRSTGPNEVAHEERHTMLVRVQ